MSEYQNLVKDIVSEVKAANVESIFGEPRQFGTQTIIPVGKISYGWGGGGGKGKSEDRDEKGEGSGVGMGMKVKPMGFIRVASDDVNYKPIVDLSPVVIATASILGLITFRLIRKLGRRA